jgi:adenylate cyclase
VATSRLSAAARRRRRSLLLVLATLAAVAGALALDASGAVDRIEFESIDTRFAIRGSQGPPADVAVVGVDAKTFRSTEEGGLGGEQWPFARARHAEVIDRLVGDGARTIAYDVQFTEPSASGQADDERLLEAVFNATEAGRPVILATTEVAGDGSTRVFGDDETRVSVGAGVGNAIMPGDAGGVVRRVPYEHDRLRSFAVESAVASTGSAPPRDAFRGGGPLVDFPGPPGTIPTYSFSDVARGAFPAGTFKDKVVVVGAVAPSLQDLSATAVSGDGLMPGPELQAAAIQTILDGLPLDEPPRWVGYLLMVLFALVPPLLALRRIPLLGRRIPPVLGFVIALALGAVYLVAAQVAFDWGYVLPVADGARPVGDLHARSARARRGVRPPAHPRPVRAVRPGDGRRPGRRQRRRGPAARRRGAPRHGALQRPAGIHDVLRIPPGGRGDRGPQRLPR